MMRKIKIIKELLSGKTLRDYRIYDYCNNQKNSIDIWLLREASDQTKRFKPIYVVCVQRPLTRTEYFEYGSIAELFSEIDRDLGYGLNNKGEFEFI